MNKHNKLKKLNNELEILTFSLERIKIKTNTDNYDVIKKKNAAILYLEEHIEILRKQITYYRSQKEFLDRLKSRIYKIAFVFLFLHISYVILSNSLFIFSKKIDLFEAIILTLVMVLLIIIKVFSYFRQEYPQSILLFILATLILLVEGAIVAILGKFIDFLSFSSIIFYINIECCDIFLQKISKKFNSEVNSSQ